MKRYYVEGLFTPRKKLKKKAHSFQPSSDLEPFAQIFWAQSPLEAVHMATDALDGGEWMGEPKVSETSEEQRMRVIGAPELPGFSVDVKKKKNNSQRKP